MTFHNTEIGCFNIFHFSNKFYLYIENKIKQYKITPSETQNIMQIYVSDS